jgi:outer membrane protein OmpA-like peptidoglycan-associated protein/tetratricopeptide (TPR) repeat protein
MKVKFLFSAALVAALQFNSYAQMAATDAKPRKNLKPRKEEKLKELPDPKTVSWQKDKAIADKLFAQGSIYNGLQYYQEALAKNPSKTIFIQQIADGNYALRDYKTAAKYYKMIVDADTAKHSNLPALFRYALCEKKISNYEESKLQFELFNRYAKNAIGVDAWIKKASREMEGCDLGIKMRDDKTFKDIKVTHLDNNVNQPFTDYAPVLRDPRTVVFSAIVSDNVVLTGKREKYATFSRIYTSKKTGDNWGAKELLAGAINTVDYHVGNTAIAADGKTMYYTQCLQDDNQQMRCDIYKSILSDSGWVAGVILDENVNQKGATTTEPAFGKNEAGDNVLYYVSDRNKEKGLDLFYSKINGDGSLGKAREVTGGINTDGDETSPFYDFQTNTLYFSSDGHINIGGQDVYKTKVVNGAWTDPENLGMPINSSVDDMYYNWSERDGLGFVVSNRPGGFGLKSETCCDDIYQVYRYRIFLAVKGNMLTADSNLPVTNQVVTLYDAKTGAPLKTYKSTDGRYFFDLEPDKDYKVSASREGFFTSSQTFSTVGKDKSDTMSFALSLKKMEKNKAYKLNNIYYEFDKAELTAASKLVLDTLFDILKENPNIVIELSSHTDGKGTDKYNNELSQKRAESCTNYLSNEKGIAKDRMVAKGYGKTMPVAPNTKPDGSDNPDGRAQNRRTEFKIIDEKKPATPPSDQQIPVAPANDGGQH